MSKGYIIENYSIKNHDKYVPPVKVINEVLKQFNGKFIVATPKHEILEGNPQKVIVIMEFITEEMAKKFYNSIEYSKYKKLYQETTEGWITITKEYKNN